MPDGQGYEYYQERRHPVQRPPRATYGLLITILAVFVLEYVVLLARGEGAFSWAFVIDVDWPYRPWSLVTSTLSHSPSLLSHILFNGMVLYFFGPTIERIVGVKRYLALFFITGAVSGVAQVQLMAYLFPGESGGALGASGALMALLGVSMVLIPKSKIIIFPFPVPIPLWVGGLAFAALDVLGVFNPRGVGNLAHLSGLALGLLYGLSVNRQLKRSGLRLVYR